MTEEESLLAAINENVELHPYDSSWAQTFEIERKRLISLLPGIFVDIEHIGSTAVPGLVAKPIIDILAGVKSISTSAEITPILCQSGYNTSTEFNDSLSDRKWFMRWANGHRTHHLHVVVHNSEIWHERMKFRNCLRSNPEYAEKYAALKARLATTYSTDREAYTNAKAEFIRAIVHEA
ncbi:GrpB family protein [Ectopseudomonas oleovorans]|uniref:GrpB family protein n=1 Tax=Ectopseudomonas oleovorans TaxID=301 RepID=UPI00241C7363|nr:GrpB family protein [Pseudomonas oleovorans]